VVRLVTAVCLCALIVSVGGCSRPSSKIVGKWQAIAADDRSAYEFFKDGSAMLRDGPARLSGTWKFLDDGRLKVETTVMGSLMTETYEVTFDSDMATFKDSQGKVQKFNKVKEFVSPVQKVKELQAEAFKEGATPEQRRQNFDLLRQEMDKLGPDQRREVRDQMREGFQRRMDEQIDAYFALPPQQRVAYLDKQITEMEKRRKEWEARRQREGQGQANIRTDAGPSGPGEPSGNPEAKSQRHNEMRDTPTAEQRAKRTAYFAALKQRRIELGLPATPFSSRPAGGATTGGSAAAR
jgi:hypothetical protein